MACPYCGEAATVYDMMCGYTVYACGYCPVTDFVPTGHPCTRVRMPSVAPTICTCDLFMGGCTCGVFKREQEERLKKLNALQLIQ
jgi:hypothetical protein